MESDMDSSSNRKRGLLGPSCEPKRVRFKCPFQDHLRLLLDVISNLTEEQKAIVKEIGFASILDFCCTSDVDHIFSWLVERFDTASRSIVLPNGFSFTIDPDVVKKVIGVPKGNRSVPMFISTEDYAKLLSLLGFKESKPSVKELCSLINADPSGDNFSRIFLLLLMSSFMSPNSHGVASRRLFAPLMHIEAIKEMDWCSFTLEWLIFQIWKCKQTKKESYYHYVVGCKLILVVPYLEFLITSHSLCTISEPRLSLWNTDIVDKYIMLDAIPGSAFQFGRLPLKHISSTPFKSSSLLQILPYQIPPDVLQSVEAIIPLRSQLEVKRNLNDISSALHVSLITNSSSSVKKYIDDVLRVLCSNKCFPCHQDSVTNMSQHYIQDSDSDVEELVQPVAIQPKNSALNFIESPNIIGEESKVYPHNFLLLPEPQLEENISVLKDFSVIFNEMCESFSSNLLVEDDCLSGIPKPICTVEQLIASEIKCYPIVLPQDPTSSSLLHPMSSEDIRSYIFEESPKLKEDRELRLSEVFKIDKIYWTDGSILSPNVQNSAEQVQKFQGGQTFPEESKSSVHVRESSSIQGSWPGMSLEARFLSASSNSQTKHVTPNAISPALFDEYTPNSVFPKKLAFSSSKSSHKFTYQVNLGTPVSDPVAIQALEEAEKSMKHISLPSFVSALQFSKTESPVCRSTQSRQTIFSTERENFFYSDLTSHVSKCSGSKRIFGLESTWCGKNDITWVDQRTLSLSMGGFVVVYVMNAFSRLFLHDQFIRNQQGLLARNENIKYILKMDVSELLMTKYLNDFEHAKTFSPENLHFNLMNATLVHIPCYFENQWFLIVANFIDMTFDVLNPDYGADSIRGTINSVVFHFKELFALAYPKCKEFNIQNFGLRFVKVPKQSNRKQSGIFVIRYFQTYNGREVETFSADDILALRQKMLYQIVSYPYNMYKLDFVKQWMDLHVQE